MNKYIKLLLKFNIFILAIICLILLNNHTFARDAKNITDWYIKDFQTEIVLNNDSTATITEKIVADCGDLPKKHGIFRVLPTRFKNPDGKMQNTPIKLISITDFSGHNLTYSTIKDNLNHTLTWKIGDAKKTVTGENNYLIKYQLGNVIYNGSDTDELFINLNGNFWEIDTDKFSGKIILPQGVNKNNAQVSYSTGDFGSYSQNLAKYNWTSNNTLEFNATDILKPGEGISVKLTFPKNIIAPYQFSFWEKYGNLFFLLIPLFILIICYRLWSKYGRDPKINPTIVPEFSIPENLSPMQMGMIYSDGTLEPRYITAEIISLAVKGAIKITQIPKKGIFTSEDYQLDLINADSNKITFSEKKLIEVLFAGEKTIKLSDLKYTFQTKHSQLNSEVSKHLEGKQWLLARSKIVPIVFIVLAVSAIFLPIVLLDFSNIYILVSFVTTAIILFIFSYLMKVRTLEGVKLFQKIKGFKLYMETAEKYRQRFNEKENIFERFLPYAIMFGITDLWIKKMKLIYGEKFFSTYYPVWFVGNWSTFDVGSFTSNLNAISSSMNSAVSAGTGGAGGGAAGGGGGGW